VDVLQYLAIAGAGLAAGIVNTIAGAGSLLTYPVLVAVGLSPLSANVTNDLGVLPGNVTGAIGFSAEVRDQRTLLRQLVPIGAAGALLGGILLLAFPARSFELAAPVFILLASIITALQPRIAARVSRSGQSRHRPMLVAIVAISIYGGYFGTGIGVLFFAALGVFRPESARHLNATKQILQLISNGVAGLLFAVTGPVHWWVAVVMGVANAVGGPIGARLSKVIPADGLRIVVSCVGSAAAIALGVRALA
jgi:uncharacterized membrane protein YfcA